MKTICCLLKKLKIEPPFNPAVPPQGIHPKKMKTLAREDICPFMVITVLFTVVKIWKLNCPLMDERIKEMWCVVYSAIKEGGNHGICLNMNGC